MVPAKRPQRPPQPRLCARILLAAHNPFLALPLLLCGLNDIVPREHVQREARLDPVEARDRLHDRDGLRVAPAAHEELGRLVQMEDREAQEEEERHETAHRVQEVPPALVGLARAVVRGCTGEVREQRPGDL